MFQKFYQQQLDNLRELAAEFSQAHPAIAPLLSKTSTDPDVERLLEGVAFLNSLIQQKLEDEFPEIIHTLTDIIFPHYLRPIPSMSIAKLTPQPGLMETLRIPAGTMVASKPVEGTECLFQTCFDTEVHPLELVGAEFVEQAIGLDKIRLTLRLNRINLSQWHPQSLRILLGENFTQGANLFILLTKHLHRVLFTPRSGGSSQSLPPQVLQTTGFNPDYSLLPYPSQSFGGYRLLQEYFLFPQKFLFIDISGWELWRDRGEGSEFDISLELEPCNLPLPKINVNQFHLFTTPIVNLFRYDAEPILRDHLAEKMLICPSIAHPDHYRIFAVEKVVGFERGTVNRKEYRPLELFSPDGGSESVYQLIHSQSPIDNSPQLNIAFPYSKDHTDLKQETLSLTLMCTNGKLSEYLRPGDIDGRTEDLPELVSVFNIMTPTASLDPPIGKDTLWTFLSHLSLNFSRITDIDNFKSLLRLYVFPESRERDKVTINLKRIDGLTDISIEPIDRLFRGTMVRGQKVVITANLDHFSGWGDLYLFGSVIGFLLGMISSINSFVELQLREQLSGEILKWPPRIGHRRLT